MNEALLHTIWKYRLLGKSQFRGSKEEDIEVISIGEHNQDSGPDFFNSKVRINDIVLAGNVEIHIKTSDWLRHKHQHDKSYDNLVLHVVYEHDKELPQNEQFNVSVLELKQYIKPSLLEQYHQLQLSKQPIACGKAIAHIPDIKWKSWLDRLAVSRLEEKTAYIEHLFEYTRNSYEDALYLLLFRNFGFKINNDAFELLGKFLPYSVLKKYADQPTQIESLLFGAAGLLDDLFDDKYPKQLQNEFEFLKHKHKLQQIKREQWKFSKTRPVNFPTIRISQLAGLIGKQSSLYHLIDQKPDLQTIRHFFEVEPNSYWMTHYSFDVETESGSKFLGDKAVESIIINTIVPYLFFMSKNGNKTDLIEYGINLLSQLPAEVNKKTKEFVGLGINTESALESQAQIYLLDNFCSVKRCLSCQVGESLLKSSSK
ncbi:MAG: hypothetical protein K0S53_169 [Bacteroidetes bacterium]|jgi:hypothetical protein|nr:hypothetical protein [Bacteroidota bacterium]MDF2451552.1 hypothetical protein [Bacteroidota bacterium]